MKLSLSPSCRSLLSALAICAAAWASACGSDPAVTRLDAVGGDAGKDDGTTLGDAVSAGDVATLDIAPDDTAPGDDVAQGDVTETIPFKLELHIPIETPRAATVSVIIDDMASPVPLDCGEATTLCRATFEVPNDRDVVWRAVLDTDAARFHPLTLDGVPEGARVAVGPRDFSAVALETEIARWGPESGASAYAVAFIAKGPPTSPNDEAIHISGSAPGLGDWDGRGVKLVDARLGTQAAVVELEGVRSIAFKATRGSWYTVEKGNQDEEIADRRSDIGGGLRHVEVNVARWADIIPRGTGTYSGDVRVLRGVRSETLDNQRDVFVWLPPGYRDNPTAHYPVVYLHDGQNTMDAGSSFSGAEWGVDEALGAVIGAGTIAPVIAVAVANTGGRTWEYTPSVDADYGGGGAAIYGHFLVDTMKPLIDAHYRTDTTAAATGLVGSSLGGLASLWLGLEYPNVFGRLGVVSPSVWWDDRVILDTVSDYSGPTSQHIWLDIGTAEGDGASPVTNARALRDRLVAKGWALGAGLTYREYEGAAHNERAWAARFGDIITDLYAR